MRLINTRTLAMKEFSDAERPAYAILSHRWEEQEINLQQWTDLEGRYRDWQGYRKVKDFCHQATSDGYEWAWADTCCINKAGNDNELSEAINSMFAWYQRAGLCYVYLSDVVGSNDPAISDSQWFTRGWTLQELIAPLDVLFFDCRWRYIGSRDQLASIISQITRIDERLLKGQERLEEFSVAQKMSWAAFRQTTRSEDRAYSLFGLFKITLPTVYGEGHGAFRRLQEEIMRTSSDQSLFAWVSTDTGGLVDIEGYETYGLLAPSPDCFYASSNIVQYVYFNWLSFWSAFAQDRCPARGCVDCRRPPDSGPFGMTNKGLQITLLAKCLGVRTTDQEAALFCYDESLERPRPCTIILNYGSGRLMPHYLGAVRTRVHQSEHNHWYKKDFVVSRIWDPPQPTITNGLNDPLMIGAIEDRIDHAHDNVRRLEGREIKAGDNKTEKSNQRRQVITFGTMIAAAAAFEFIKRL